MNSSRLRNRLRADEGIIPHAYQDSEGYWTIGVGRLIDKRLNGGLSADEIDYLLDNDIRRIVAEANTFHWFSELDDVRQEVIVNMLFNLGLERFSGFHRMIAAIIRGDYLDAAREGLDSKWARQVGTRAIRLMKALESGRWSD